jgi:hypothetical protein
MFDDVSANSKNLPAMFGPFLFMPVMKVEKYEGVQISKEQVNRDTLERMVKSALLVKRHYETILNCDPLSADRETCRDLIGQINESYNWAAK